MEQTRTPAVKQHTSSGRLDYLDSIRGICVLLIVIEHHLMGADFVQRYLYSFSLTPFFLISGFLYARKREWEEPFRVILAKNCRRLLYPFFTFSAVNLIWNFLYYKVVFPSAEPDLCSLGDMLLYTVTTYGYNALWYIPCMFFGTLLFTVLRRCDHHRLIWAVCSVSILIFYILFDKMLSGHGLSSRIYCYLFRCSMAMIFLYAGHLLYELLQTIDRRKERLLLSLCLLLSAVFMALYRFCPEQFPIVNLATHRLGNPYFYYLSGLAPSVCLFILCSRFRKGAGVLSYFGRHSLIVMALHMDIFVKIAWYVVAKLRLSFGDTGNSIIVIALELAMAPVFIWFINKYLPFLLKHPQKAVRS